ncbi:acyltransferase [Paenibacillus sp. JX-17]|uniref:Acyltransferase n=1 Tax=Paenibacillus lacisoli TaxID=3064525 RepID=A0ABT9C8W5_9BACL|nr:acyltransferase [Paenibacillus sp. JX-17]MDO7905705.1 acyltransferase [Paenibacillus sp. JX-17]
MPRKTRIQEIDLLRGLAFLAVVMQHAIAHYAAVPQAGLEDAVVMTMILTAAKFAVPVFIFITGLVLFYNYDGELHYGQFLVKRFKDIIVPYLLWSVVFYVFNHGPVWNITADLQQLGRKLFTGKTSFHLWYIVMIIQFYLLFPVVRRLIRFIVKRNTDKLNLIALIAAGLLYVGLTGWIGRIAGIMSGTGIPLLEPLFTIYADRNVLYFYFYFVLGAAAGLNLERWRSWIMKRQVYIFSAGLVLSLWLIYDVTRPFEGVSSGFNFNRMALLHPFMAVFCVVSVLVVYRLAMMLNKAASQRVLGVIRWLGLVSYGAYLIHPLMLRLAYVLDAAIYFNLNATLRMLISFLLCLLLSGAASWLLSVLPLGRYTAGLSLRRKKNKTVPGIKGPGIEAAK